MDINFLAIGIALVSILISITFHEAMHAYVSHWLGDDTAFHEGRLTLNPLAHIDPFATVLLPLMLALLGLPPFGAAKPVPFDPDRVKGGEWGAALIGIAGPLTNLFLAIVAGGVLRLDLVSGAALDAVLIFTGVNIAFFLFNMIPFPPLDGSRLLYAVAPDGIRALMRGIEATGLVGILVFVLVIFSFFQPVFRDLFAVVMRFIVG